MSVRTHVNMVIIFLVLVVFFKLNLHSHAFLIDESNQDGFLLVVKQNTVVQFMIDHGLHKFHKLENLNITHSVDFDMKHNCLFWSDTNDHNFYCNCPKKDGKRISVQLFSSTFSNSLAYDWMSGTLYFSLYELRKIDMVKIVYAGSSTASAIMRRTIINTTTTARKIVVHPKRGYLFWTEFHSETDALISRSNLDGSAARVLFRHPKIYKPNAISVDSEKDRIYWADSLVGYVGSSDLNGRNVITVCKLLKGDLWIQSITVRAGYLFWYDWNNSAGIYYTEKGE